MLLLGRAVHSAFGIPLISFAVFLGRLIGWSLNGAHLGLLGLVG